MSQTGQNEPCPCGSGKKCKSRCLAKRETIAKIRDTHWSIKEIAEIATEDIIVCLRAFGVPVDVEMFRRDAPQFYSAYELAEHWWRTYPINARGFDEDFPWMACAVLWGRLLPDVMYTECLDAMMQEGYSCLERGDRQGACRWWLQVWEHLKARFTPAIRSVNDAEQVFGGSQSLFNWCQDLEMELRNAGLDAREFMEATQQYCTEFCALLPETERSILINMKQARAESYYCLGHPEEGDQAFQQLIDDYPGEAFIYLVWGGMYHWNPRNKWPVDYEKAERIYQLALQNHVDEQALVLERLELLNKTRREADIAMTSD